MKRWWAALVVAWVPVALLAQAGPESLGMSAERLGRIRPALQAYVDSGQVAGAVTLLLRDGHIVALDTVGWADREARAPMRSTTIFRIASMSKAITSVAAMMLVEDGKLLLSDPIARYLPAFSRMRVLVSAADSSRGTRDSLVPADRDITVHDLLTHRAGITYVFADDSPTQPYYLRAGVHDGIAEGEGTIAQMVDLIAAQPLAFQPGTKYLYGLNTDVLGRLIEVVSGMSLERFLSQRIFAPLQLRDTRFWVPDADVARIAVPYTQDSAGRLRPMDPLQRFGHTLVGGKGTRGSRTYFSGGAGLYSTAPDYARFLQMLANGGELDGVRLLAPTTIALMTASATGDLEPPPFGQAAGFGLGFEVVTDLGQYGMHGSVGRYAWGGAYGSTFWVDPKQRLVGVMMIQLIPRPGVTIGDRFQTLAYSAIVR
jgi:CubicO group peptidase (beta-lactamase class C family)